MISLKHGDSKPCNINRSLYLMKRLISAQGLDAYFRRADHNKQKSYRFKLLGLLLNIIKKKVFNTLIKLITLL
jgi:hypothetical protein